MSNYYNPQRTRNLYDPKDTKPYRLSRTKLDLFLNCPRCFYLDRRLGVGQPPGFPFNLNSAVDKLLKKEFDIHRAKGTPHPLMKHYKINAIPLAHEKIDEWRDSMRRGIAFHINGTNILVTGGVDDVWVTPKGSLIIVDYKATSKEEEVSLEADWQIGYKRQMEIYQWLFRKNGFKVSPTSYFVYCNGDTDADAFDGKLEFRVKLLPHKGKTGWVEKTIKAAIKCLQSDEFPESGLDCDFCKYRNATKEAEKVFRKDEFFKLVKDSLWTYNEITASAIQEKFNIGYARAARILDELEQAGLVGPGEGSKPREVLTKKSKKK